MIVFILIYKQGLDYIFKFIMFVNREVISKSTEKLSFII